MRKRIADMKPGDMFYIYGVAYKYLQNLETRPHLALIESHEGLRIIAKSFEGRVFNRKPKTVKMSKLCMGQVFKFPKGTSMYALITFAHGKYLYMDMDTKEHFLVKNRNVILGGKDA